PLASRRSTCERSGYPSRRMWTRRTPTLAATHSAPNPEAVEDRVDRGGRCGVHPAGRSRIPRSVAAPNDRHSYGVVTGQGRTYLTY
ncbi:MAG TPA: hypothetical protein VII30_03325, partial [Gemmatimonadaceae bacterium]